MTGKVLELLISEEAGKTLQSNQTVQLKAGRGVVGDRYYLAQGTHSKVLKDKPDVELTLIEQEEIKSFDDKTGLGYVGRDFRRNIVTEGIRLNDLVGKEFYIGKVRLKGIRLCEPCAYLSGLLGKEIMEHMIHKSGLRAEILTDGFIDLADSVGLSSK